MTLPNTPTDHLPARTLSTSFLNMFNTYFIFLTLDVIK